MYIHIYIYIERERERQRERDLPLDALEHRGVDGGRRREGAYSIDNYHYI